MSNSSTYLSDGAVRSVRERQKSNHKKVSEMNYRLGSEVLSVSELNTKVNIGIQPWIATSGHGLDVILPPSGRQYTIHIQQTRCEMKRSGDEEGRVLAHDFFCLTSWVFWVASLLCTHFRHASKMGYFCKFIRTELSNKFKALSLRSASQIDY